MTLEPMTLFLAGDVMTGRGIDQILPHPGNPTLHEPYVESAEEYVLLGEQIHGPISRPVGFDYIWGDAPAELRSKKVRLSLVNLETSVTSSNERWEGKTVHYRMSPENIPCLNAAPIHCCSLANNHVLDWGIAGLVETLETLRNAGIRNAGAGRRWAEAREPAVFSIGPGRRVLVFGIGSRTSGIPTDWAATETQPGICLLESGSIEEDIRAVRRPGDVVIVSIHWGENWGYSIPSRQIDLAHRFIDAGADLIHGHSSHHVKGIEVYRERLILYGCGDLIDDYEGIGGFEDYRGDLGLMYFPSVDASTGKLLELRMIPTRVLRFQIRRASDEDSDWLLRTLNRESEPFGLHVGRQKTIGELIATF